MSIVNVQAYTQYFDEVQSIYHFHAYNETGALLGDVGTTVYNWIYIVNGQVPRLIKATQINYNQGNAWRVVYGRIYSNKGEIWEWDPEAIDINTRLNQIFPGYQVLSYSITNVIEPILSTFSSYHRDPIYIEATKLKYTDGTYNFIKGVATADRARKAAYKSLLNTYGTFYKGTEEQLSNSFTQSLDG